MQVHVNWHTSLLFINWLILENDAQSSQNRLFFDQKNQCFLKSPNANQGSFFSVGEGVVCDTGNKNL